jgi:hypothetical protein
MGIGPLQPRYLPPDWLENLHPDGKNVQKSAPKSGFSAIVANLYQLKNFW